MTLSSLIEDLAEGERASNEEAFRLLEATRAEELCEAAARRRDQAHGRTVSFSKKVFIPLTRLCRDVCHYCTFAKAPATGRAAYLTAAEALAIARAGREAGCKEALFTLGDKPELRYSSARRELDALGHGTTASYLAEIAALVLRETGLLPHLNPGVLTSEEVGALRRVSVSMGLMLESASERLCERGQAHYGSPDKHPAARLETLRVAGERQVPFTTGILIGIGETRTERIASLLAIRDLHEAHGHVQEVIIQNFRPKPETRMAACEPANLDDHLWTIAVARLIFAPDMNVQAPPNLSAGPLSALIAAGINDWGGVSPVTVDHVNPEAPWPHLQDLARETAAAGKDLVERLAIYPNHARHADRWVDEAVRPALLKEIDGQGRPRGEGWWPGAALEPPDLDVFLLQRSAAAEPSSDDFRRILAKAQRGNRLDEGEIVRLFEARASEFSHVCRAADEVRRALNGDVVSYVVTRNINYTNICSYRCQFCAFSKGKLSDNLRGRPYDLDLQEIAERAVEARRRGASEVCMQGGIHPAYTGRHYIDICKAVKAAAPNLHVHAFSPLEIHQGASTLGISVAEFLAELKRVGLGTLPGTAAEILDDEVRERLCPDKIRTAEWVQVMRTAHRIGIRSTATIMFGHLERYEHWARHLLVIRDLQEETGGFTEFVPLPFVHMESPVYLKGRARRGPTFREAVLMHAIARLVLHPHIGNIQSSWVKLGPEGAKATLKAGVNDLGGTLMNESISRAAGAVHGQEMTPSVLENLILSAGRVPRQRTTLYQDAPEALRRLAFQSTASLKGVQQASRPNKRPPSLEGRTPKPQSLQEPSS